MAAVKIGEVLSLIERFAALLEDNRAQAAVIRRLLILCDMFDGAEKMTVTTFLNEVRRAPLPASRKQPTIAKVVPALESLHKFLGPTTRESLIKGLESVLGELRRHEGVSLAAYVKSVHEFVASASRPDNSEGATAMDERLLDDYVARLKAALGDDGLFGPLMEELRADKRVGQLEAVAIATRFVGYTPPKSPRYKSIKHIRERQESLMAYKRQGPTSASRPAA